MSKDDERPTCGNCRYWDERKDGDGFCRRYAPRPVVLDGEQSTWRYAAFPIVDAGDWCGELIEVEPK